MKYWGYFLAKLAAAGLLIFVIEFAIRWSFPRRITIFYSQQDLFGTTLLTLWA